MRKGRVCEKHQEFCPNGTCPWCLGTPQPGGAQGGMNGQEPATSEAPDHPAPRFLWPDGIDPRPDLGEA
ncbi:MAG TPA: hypothetical protein VI356_09520 [Myxococcales bacterium]